MGAAASARQIEHGKRTLARALKAVPNNKYSWNKGAPYSRADPMKVGVELEQVRKEAKQLTPEAVVMWARSHATSALHSLFNWNDRDAADHYRRHTAQDIIIALRVVIREPSGPTHQRVFVRVTNSEPNQPSMYVHVTEVKKNPAWAAEIMKRAQQDLVAWAIRYKQLQDALPDVFDSIKEIIAKLDE